MGMRRKYPRVGDPNDKTFVPAFVILLNVVPKIKYLLSAWSWCDLATSCSIDFDAFQLQVVFEDFKEWSSVHSLLCDMILSTMYITIIIESSSLCALTNKGFNIGEYANVLVVLLWYWLPEVARFISLPKVNGPLRYVGWNIDHAFFILQWMGTVWQTA